jgi:hypothetical protein
MAIEVVEAGYFIPNKAGYPVALSEEPKTTATKAVEEGAARQTGWAKISTLRPEPSLSLPSQT